MIVVMIFGKTMAKNFYSQFHYADFIQDTELLTNEATGGWIRILCRMWKQQAHTIEISIADLSRLLRTTEKEAMEIFLELEAHKIIDTEKSGINTCQENVKLCQTDVKITCRRLEKEEKLREYNRLKKREERIKPKCQ